MASSSQTGSGGQAGFVFVFPDARGRAGALEAIEAALLELRAQYSGTSVPQAELAQALADWLTLNCRRANGEHEAAVNLLRDFVAATRIDITQKAFGALLSQQGFGQRKTGGVIHRTGLRLLRPDEVFAVRRADVVGEGAHNSQGAFGEAGRISRNPGGQSLAKVERKS